MGLFGRDKDMPAAGQTPGGGRGHKPGRVQVSVTNENGTMLWKQTSSLFGSGKPKPAKPAKAPKPEAQPKRPRWFS